MMQSPSTRLLFTKAGNLCKRNIGIFAPSLQKASDPIQQLFLDKIKEFKSKSAGGKLVEPSPEIQKELKNDKERASRQFNIAPETDVTTFPTFNFTDRKLEVPGIVADKAVAK